MDDRWFRLGDHGRSPTEMIRLFITIVVCAIATVGCTPETERRDPWFSQMLTLEDTGAITIVTDGGFITDGGTMELYAVTESGRRCSIRLNQHTFFEGYRLDSTDAPGRLCFNDRLIDVRSADEHKLIQLLKNANFHAVGIEGMRQLIDHEIVEPAHLHALASDSVGLDMHYFRDSIVEYVESDRYVETARSVFSLPADTGGEP